jgi:hypothetical protein
MSMWCIVASLLRCVEAVLDVINGKEGSSFLRRSTLILREKNVKTKVPFFPFRHCEVCMADIYQYKSCVHDEE